ncbi:DUF3515 family protein [Microbacterium horticulturae]|uniref:DUF3515 family protein n=1 Tax=Microbacterium horticulturae TaxID=3028316 RepID=A0ABY8BXT3_9MICO|nr:DUF3515 family protein [Microbacterium sp. KACC 23027]WEG07393.1 DUF3515 family protein [Microbacterium sp. KACC 23027]
MTRLRRSLAVCLVAAGIALTGCSTTIPLDQPTDANNPKCAEIMVRLPKDISGQERVWTDAQSTAAWGSPTRVIMACGMTPPGPSTLKCVSLGGVDWLVDESEQPNFRITSYGRTPAVQVYIDGDTTSVDPNTVLSTLGRLVSAHTTKTAACSNPDTITG